MYTYVYTHTYYTIATVWGLHARTVGNTTLIIENTCVRVCGRLEVSHGHMSRCNCKITKRHPATHCNTLQPHSNTGQNTETLQHSNTLQHTGAVLQFCFGKKTIILAKIQIDANSLSAAPVFQKSQISFYFKTYRIAKTDRIP